MRIRVAVPDAQLDGSTLDALLEAVTRAGHRQILKGAAPDFRKALKRLNIRWKPEAFADGEHFDLPATVAARGWGDCDDLGPWYAASLRASGEDPLARAFASKSGPQRWHVRVRRGDGRIQDPSRAAGMGANVSGEVGVLAMPARALAMPGDAAIAVVRDPRLRQWWTRTDLPWGKLAHLVSIARAPTPEGALARSVMGALETSDGASPAHAEYLDAIAADLLARPRKSEVGFLGKVLDIAKGPLGGAAASLIPGGGIAHSMLSSMMPGGGKGGGKKGAPPPMPPAPSAPPAPGRGGASMPMRPPMQNASLPGGGHIAWSPHTLGPIIVRF